MLMSMSHSQRLELEVLGGATSSVFLRTEALLFKSMEATDLQKSLRLLSRQKGSRMDSYRSLMDWLYVSTFGPPAWRECMRFYDDKGPCLKELRSKEEIDRLDLLLLGSVRVLSDGLFVRERWDSFVTRMNMEYSRLLA